MTVNGTSGTTGTNAYSSTPSTTVSSKTLGQDAFMTLLLTQLTHQDPSKPQDDTEFIAQLATFSQLEKLTDIAASMKALEQAVVGTGSTDASTKASSTDTATKTSGSGTTTTSAGSTTSSSSTNSTGGK